MTTPAGDEPDDTRSLTLCTSPRRRGAEVTVGESGLLVAPILGLLRTHGPEEAARSWPQLADDEIAVLAQLAKDVQVQADDAVRDQVETLREVLVGLVRLKDGPRDEPYRKAKNAAWDRARQVLADTGSREDG